MSLSTSYSCLKLLFLQPWSTLWCRGFRSPDRREYCWQEG
jgi:hypothetical protein